MNHPSSGLILEKVCEYFYYNERFKDAKEVPDMDIPLELCLEMLMAADYLDCMSPLSRSLSHSLLYHPSFIEGGGGKKSLFRMVQGSFQYTLAASFVGEKCAC